MGACIDNLFEKSIYNLKIKKTRVGSKVYYESNLEKMHFAFYLQRELALVVNLMPCGLTGHVQRDLCCGKRTHTPLPCLVIWCLYQSAVAALRPQVGSSQGSVSDEWSGTQWRTPQRDDHLGGHERWRFWGLCSLLTDTQSRTRTLSGLMWGYIRWSLGIYSFFNFLSIFGTGFWFLITPVIKSCSGFSVVNDYFLILPYWSVGQWCCSGAFLICGFVTGFCGLGAHCFT